MKSFFSRLNGDTQASSSKATKESSYRFWIPSNPNAERSPPKPIPVHPDVAASRGEKRTRPVKSTPAAPLETQAIHTNDMLRYTTRPDPGSSSTPYSQNHPPPSSRTPRPHEHNDTKYQAPSREARGPAYPGLPTFRETSSKPHRSGRDESVAPIPREIWLPSTAPGLSKQGEDQSKLHASGTSEKPEQYRENGNDRDRVKEIQHRGKGRDRDKREREREERVRTRESEREERERSRAKERHEKEREIARAKREQDRNLGIDRGKDRDKYAERDRREQERDSDREGVKEKNRTKDRSRKESSNLARGERAWDSDVPYDGERIKQDERKTRRRDRITEGVEKDDNRESHKEKGRWVEKEPERARERLGGQIKHRAEATDGEQFTRRLKTPAPDRERRKDLGVGWSSDTHTGHNRKLVRKMSNTLLNQPHRAEEGESSDTSTRLNRVQHLTKRLRGEEGGSSSKIIHSRQGMPNEPLASTKASVGKATIVTMPDNVQLPVHPTPQHMPIYLPPKESNAIDPGLPPTIAPLNVVSTREAEAPPRRETVNRLKSNEPPPHAAENISKPREADTSIVRRPPSRGPAQPQNLISSHPTIAPSVKGKRESGYIHRPKHPHPPPTIVHDRLQTLGSSLLPEMLPTSTQAEGSKEPKYSLERLPDSRSKEELELDLVPSVLYKVQHRIPPQSARAEPSRQPIVSTPQNVTSLTSTDPPPNSDAELPRKVTYSLLQQGNNTQIPPETDPSYNLQFHNRTPTVMFGNRLAPEAHLKMETPVAQVVLGELEPMNPPTMQRLHSAPSNVNIIQDTGKQTVTSSLLVVSKTNEIEALQSKDEVSLSSIKLVDRSQLYTESSIDRPPIAIDGKSSLERGIAVRPHMIDSASVSQNIDSSKANPLVPGWRNNVNVISSNTLLNQANMQATTSSVAVDPKISPSKSSQLRSHGQEGIGIAIMRPSTTTGFRQSTAGKNLRHHNISLSHSNAQNSLGISIPRPATATAIKQSGSGPSPRQTFNLASQMSNPFVEEVHMNIFPGPSIPRHDSIPAPNPQPVTVPITEKGSGFPVQPYNMAHSAGTSLGRGHPIVLLEDGADQRDAPGSHRQGHTDRAADLNIILPLENFTSQASTMPNPKPDNLRNVTTSLAVSIPTSNDNLVRLHPASMPAQRQDNRGASDHVSITENSHLASKENSVVPQRITPTSVNNDSTENNIFPSTLNIKASSAQPILPLGTSAPQIQIQRPHTSHQASKESSIVPQRATLTSANNDSTENNIIPTSLRAKASSAHPITLPFSSTVSQLQIQRPLTSHQASKENSVPQRTALASVNNASTGNIVPQSTLLSSFTTPQIQIQRPLTSHQASKEKGVVSPSVAVARVNNDSSGNNIIPSTSNAKASSTQPIILPFSSSAPQIQIQRPSTSHQASKENSVPQRAIANNDSTESNIIPTSLNAKASIAHPITLLFSSTAPLIQTQRPPTSHRASKENSVVPQGATVTSVNNDGIGSNIIPTSLNARASSTQSVIPSSFTAPQVQIQRPPISHQASTENNIIPQRPTESSVNNERMEYNIIPQSTLPSSFNTPQIHIQRPPTSLSTRNNSGSSALPSGVIVPQIQIHHLISTTGTGNKSESSHTDFHADASIPRVPSVRANLEMPDTKRLATANANVLPIRVDQPQDFLDSGNKLHKSVHLVPTSTVDANQVRPSIIKRTLPLHAEDSRFNILRTGLSQEVTTQTVISNHSTTLSSHQPDPASSANQTRRDSIQSVIPSMETNNDLAQGSPSLGFFNNAFSEVLHLPLVRRSGQGHQPVMKADENIVSAAFEADEDDVTNQAINMKTSQSLVNRDTTRNMLRKEQPEVPWVERLTTQKDAYTNIHNSKEAFSQLPSGKLSSPPSQPRIQHPGLAEILSSPSNNAQPPNSSAAHHQPTNSSTVFSKSGSSPKLQGSLDKRRPDDKLVSPRSSPSRQLPSDLRLKEVEQHLHESPKRQLRSAHLENLLSDPRSGDSLGLMQSNMPSSSSYSSVVLNPLHTTSTVSDGVTRPILEPMPHVDNKKTGQSGPSYPEVLITTGGPSQGEELASRKTRPASIVDSKPLANSIPHYQATIPLRESTSTTRHQHSLSLPVHLLPSANVPLADGSLRPSTHSPLHHHSSSQTKSGYLRPPDPQTLAPNIAQAASDSEETILMTPSSLARSVMLKPTVSRQSVTPSMSSHTARKGTGLFTMFRSKTPAQPPPQYEIWHPNTSSKTAESNAALSATVPSSFPEQTKPSAPTPMPVTSVPTAIERPSQKSKIFTPFRYLTTKRNRAVSMVSVEAQDGTAPSTIVGSPTASMLSQAPFQPPAVRDPMQATEEWRNKEDEPHPNGKLRRQRPGVVFDVAEERPEDDRRRRPKRTRTRHKSSSKPT